MHTHTHAQIEKRRVRDRVEDGNLSSGVGTVPTTSETSSVGICFDLKVSNAPFAIGSDGDELRLWNDVGAHILKRCLGLVLQCSSTLLLHRYLFFRQVTHYMVAWKIDLHAVNKYLKENNQSPN